MVYVCHRHGKKKNLESLLFANTTGKRQHVATATATATTQLPSGAWMYVTTGQLLNISDNPVSYFHFVMVSRPNALSLKKRQLSIARFNKIITITGIRNSNGNSEYKF